MSEETDDIVAEAGTESHGVATKNLIYGVVFREQLAGSRQKRLARAGRGKEAFLADDRPLKSYSSALGPACFEWLTHASRSGGYEYSA